MRSELEAAVALNLSQQKISEIRKQLSLRLGLTLAQITAIGAWKRSSDKKGLVLKPIKIEESPQTEDPVTESSNAQFDSTDLQRKLVHKQIAREHYELNVAAQRTLDRTRFELRQIFQNYYSQEEVDEMIEEVQLNSSEIQQYQLLRDVDVKRGERVDYNNNAKKKSRDWWLNLLWHRTQSENKGGMNILLLPGAECHEISPVISMGFPPENLRCYNLANDPGATATFVRNCQAQGVFGWRLGDLADLLPQETERIHGGNLDFYSWYCEKNERILSYLPLPKNGRTYFSVNFAKVREGGKIKAVFREIAALFRSPLKLNMPRKSLQERLEEDNKRVVRGIMDPNLKTSEARKEALPILIGEHLGMAREENWLCFDEVREIIKAVGQDPNFDDYDSYQKATRAKYLMHGFENAIAVELERAISASPYIHTSEGFPQIMATVLFYIANKACFCEPEIIHSEQYEYQSPSGMPFLSHFIVSENFQAYYGTMQRTIRFYLKVMRSFIEGLKFNNPEEVVRKLLVGGELGETVNFKSGGKFAFRGSAQNCELVFKNEDPKLTVSIPFRLFLNDINRFMDHLKQVYSQSDYINEFSKESGYSIDELQSRFKNSSTRPVAQRIQTESIQHGQIINSQVSIGRNDMCICGSGKKFKKCCGRLNHEAPEAF